LNKAKHQDYWIP